MATISDSHTPRENRPRARFKDNQQYRPHDTIEVTSVKHQTAKQDEKEDSGECTVAGVVSKRRSFISTSPLPLIDLIN